MIVRVWYALSREMFSVSELVIVSIFYEYLMKILVHIVHVLLL